MAVSVSLLMAVMQSLMKSPWTDQENENVNKHNWQKRQTPSAEGDRVKQRQAEQPLNGPNEQIVIINCCFQSQDWIFNVNLCFQSEKIQG